MREIAVPDRAGDFPAAIRLTAPDPNPVTFVMDGPAATPRHAVQDPAVPVDSDIADNLQLLGKYEEERFRRAESRGPKCKMSLQPSDRGSMGRHADGVVGGIALHSRGVFTVECGDEFLAPPLNRFFIVHGQPIANRGK